MAEISDKAFFDYLVAEYNQPFNGWDFSYKELLFSHGAPEPTTWNLAFAIQQLNHSGWQIIEQQEAFHNTRFHDVGAIVYYLKAIPWEVPDFSVEKYFDKLVKIRDLIRQHGPVDVPFHSFFIVARKL